MHVPNQTEGRWLMVQIIARQNYSNPGREWKGSWCITTGAWALFSFTTMDRSTAIVFGSPAASPAAAPWFRVASSVFCSSPPANCCAGAGFSPISTAGAAPKQRLTCFFLMMLYSWVGINTRSPLFTRFSGMCELSLVQEGIYKVLLVNISLCWKIGLRREKSRAGSKLDTFTTKYQGSSSFSKETKKGIFNCW